MFTLVLKILAVPVTEEQDPEDALESQDEGNVAIYKNNWKERYTIFYKNYFYKNHFDSQ